MRLGELPPQVLALPMAGFPPPPGAGFWSACRALIEAYPARASDPDQTAQLLRLREALRKEAGPLAERLAPGAPWKVDVALGHANFALRPWVAFLDPRHTTSTRSGLFALVDLLWQREPALRVGLAVAAEEAEARGPQVSAQLGGTPALEALRARGFSASDGRAVGDPETHQGRLQRILSGGLLAWKTVPLRRALADREALDADLGALLQVYRGWVETHGQEQPPADPDRPIQDLARAVELLAAAASRRHLTFSREQLGALLLSWRVCPLVLLAGPPGSGKSTLVRLLADLGARVHTSVSLEPEPLAEHLATATRDTRHPHVLLLEGAPRVGTEPLLLRWLEERRPDPTEPGLLVAWTLDPQDHPPGPRLLDRVNLLRLVPPEPGALPSDPPPPRPEAPGILPPALLCAEPGGWRGLLARHDGPVAAAKVHLDRLLRDTQTALARHGSPVQLSWRAADGLLEYVLDALACQLDPDGLASAIDQQLRQRVLPALLRARRPLGPELVADLIRVWAPLAGQGAGSACAQLEVHRARPRGFFGA